MDISSIRKDYKLRSLAELDVQATPYGQFDVWFKEAVSAEVLEVNAMVLSTSSLDGVPSARVVLLKDFNDAGFVFYTNYESQKGKELARNPHASLTFFWPQLERQVRLNGVAEKVSRDESAAYFQSRPVGSQIGALSSPQSQLIVGRQQLEHDFEQYNQEFGEGKPIPMPDYWGGYRLKPFYVEFWQGRPSRLHDRIAYEKVEESWKTYRLAP